MQKVYKKLRSENRKEWSFIVSVFSGDGRRKESREGLSAVVVLGSENCKKEQLNNIHLREEGTSSGQPYSLCPCMRRWPRQKQEEKRACQLVHLDGTF